MRALAVLLAILVPLAGCVEPAPQVPTGQIDGAVLDQLLNPYGDVEVQLVGTDMRDSTNALGGFTFRDVPVGAYMIKVTIEGVGEDTQGIAVAAGFTSRIVLQVAKPPATYDYTTHLSHKGQDAFGAPATECLSCAWHTQLNERRPDHVRLHAQWESQNVQGKSAAATMAIIELRDENGHLLAKLEGQSPLEARLRGSDIPASADALRVRVLMHPDNQVPHPGVEVETALDLYYGTEL